MKIILQRVACFISATIITITTASAQENLTLVGMKKVQQASWLRVGEMPDNRLYIGVPALTGVSLGFANNRYSFADLFVGDGKTDSIRLTFDNILPKIKDKNLVALSASTQLLGLGFKAGENYFSFNVITKLDGALSYNKEFMVLLAKGNTALANNSKNLASMRLNASAYTEYALGMVHHGGDENNPWTIGGRFKVLSGIANIQTKEADISIQTDTATFATLAGIRLLVNGSSIDTGSGGRPKLFGGNNLGFGVDLGCSFQPNESWKFGVSVLDLGFISWKDNTVNYSSGKAASSINLGGWDVNKVFANNSNFNPYADSISTQLKNTMYPNKSSQPYTTALNSKVVLTADYQITGGFSANGLLMGKWLNNKCYPGFAVGVEKVLEKWLQVTANYNYMYNKGSMGLGMSWDLLPIQLYAACDNILYLNKLDYARTTNIHLGMNIIIRNKAE